MLRYPVAALLAVGAPLAASLATPLAAQQAVDSAWTPAPFPAAHLDTLVAPIALFPDNLVGLMLVASTFPGQVVEAHTFVNTNLALQDSVLLAAAGRQGWDASVTALVMFPDALAKLASNLEWTSALGQAYAFQASETMAAVQRMRALAVKAGTLKTTPQQTVRTVDGGTTIIIQPTDTLRVYVPQYSTSAAFGSPFAVPGFTPAPGVTTTITFGPPVMMMPWWYMSPWGWNQWGMRWGPGGGVWIGGGMHPGNPSWNVGVNWGFRPWGPRPGPWGPWGPHPIMRPPPAPRPPPRPPQGGGGVNRPGPAPRPPGGGWGGGGVNQPRPPVNQPRPPANQPRPPGGGGWGGGGGAHMPMSGGGGMHMGGGGSFGGRR